MARIPTGVRFLLPGDRVDLEGDPYADPKHDNVALEFAYAVVVSVEQETPECVAVTFDRDVVGFPTEHTVPVEL